HAGFDYRRAIFFHVVKVSCRADPRYGACAGFSTATREVLRTPSFEITASSNGTPGSGSGDREKISVPYRTKNSEGSLMTASVRFDVEYHQDDGVDSSRCGE